MRRFLTWLKIFFWTSAATVLLAGCFKPDERRAGVDDFPNSINAQVRTYLNESKQSEEIGQVPAVADSILGKKGFYVDPAVKKSAMAKISAASQASNALFSAPALKIALVCHLTVKFDSTYETPIIPITVVNSKTLCLDTGAMYGSIIQANSLSTYGSGKVERADITDADGDGIVNPAPAGKSKARFVFSTTEAGIMEKTVLVVGPGPDNNFDTEPDNIVYEVAWTKVKLSTVDTLASATYTDADNDSSVINNLKPSLVDLVMFEKGPTKDHPDAVWSQAQLRLNIVYGVANQEARRVHFNMETADGRVTSSDLVNLDGSPDFNMHSKLKAHFLSIGKAAQDTVDTMDVIITMKVGADLNDKRDDSVYAMDIHCRKKLGEEKQANFAFTSDFPIPSGQSPQSGTLSMNVEYTDQSTVEVQGKLENKVLDVKVKTRDDKRLHVIWDALGRGILLEAIP